MLVIPIKTRIFKEGEEILPFIETYIKKIPESSVIVVTSKIVALSESRTAYAANEKEKEQIIRAESKFAIQTKYVWLTIKDGMIMPSAGVDESNANGKIILLPENSFKSADLIRRTLRKKYGLKNLGVLITDSRVMPLRAGVTAVALGYAGFRGLKDYRKSRDIFGRKFKYSRVGVADSLATAAVLLMGEGNERQPLAIIKNAPVEFCERVNTKELLIDIEDDIYQPLLAKFSKNKK